MKYFSFGWMLGSRPKPKIFHLKCNFILHLHYPLFVVNSIVLIYSCMTNCKVVDIISTLAYASPFLYIL